MNRSDPLVAVLAVAFVLSYAWYVYLTRRRP